jgi:serine/threonine-protein kinase RIO1
MEGVIVSPVGLLVKSNVLVMDFIGKDMKNAPRLRDAEIKGV